MQQKALITILGFPLGGSHQKLRVPMHPSEIGVEGLNQALERLLEAQLRVIDPLNFREPRK